MDTHIHPSISFDRYRSVLFSWVDNAWCTTRGGHTHYARWRKSLINATHACISIHFLQQQKNPSTGFGKLLGASRCFFYFCFIYGVPFFLFWFFLKWTSLHINLLNLVNIFQIHEPFFNLQSFFHILGNIKISRI